MPHVPTGTFQHVPTVLVREEANISEIEGAT